MALSISSTDAQGIFTKELVAAFSDQKTPMALGRSFFKEVESYALELSIQVERLGEFVASDVVRGSDGNRNTFDTSTEKIFIPAYFNEYMDITKLDLYKYLYNSPTISTIVLDQFIVQAADKMLILRNKIDRRYELMCWQAMLSGIVTFDSTTQIDFKRKAASLVALTSGNYWTDAGVDPNVALDAAGDFMRQTGKTSGVDYIAVFSTEAWNAYINNASVIEKGKTLNQSTLVEVAPALQNSVGGIYKGKITTTSYNFHAFVYNEVYNTSPTATAKYMAAKKIVFQPMVSRNVLTYAAVPQLLDGNIQPVKGKFSVSEFPDPRKKTKDIVIESAGLPVTVAVDQNYTLQPIA